MPVFTKNEDGQSGMLLRECTNEYKVRVVLRAIREKMGLAKYKRVKEPVELWLGISVDEASRMKDSLRKWLTNKYPLIEKGMNRSNCIAYLKRKGFEVPPKSACICCPFHDDTYWKNMKKYSPKEFKDACDFDEAIRTNTCRKGKRKNDIYLHRSCKPLKDIKFDDGNMELFGNECEGHCGL